MGCYSFLFSFCSRAISEIFVGGSVESTFGAVFVLWDRILAGERTKLSVFVLSVWEIGFERTKLAVFVLWNRILVGERTKLVIFVLSVWEIGF